LFNPYFTTATSECDMFFVFYYMQYFARRGDDEGDIGGHDNYANPTVTASIHRSLASCQPVQRRFDTRQQSIKADNQIATHTIFKHKKFSVTCSYHVKRHNCVRWWLLHKDRFQPIAMRTVYRGGGPGRRQAQRTTEHSAQYGNSSRQEAGACSEPAYTSSRLSGVVPIKKPPGFRHSHAFLSIISACGRLSNE